MAMIELSFGPVLIGLRGSGKSTVAPLLARRLGFVALDADAELERHEGRTVQAIFRDHGEQEFRRLERAVLMELLGQPLAVLATGGGAVLHEVVRCRLRERFTVWLHAEVDVLAARIAGSGRPSLTGGDIGAEL